MHGLRRGGSGSSKERATLRILVGQERAEGPDESVPADLVTRVEPRRGWHALALGELWSHRELLYFFAWRDVKVRYKQTVLGAGWVIMQPLIMMVLFSVFFGHLAKIPSNGVPYPAFALAAVVPWTFFSTALTQSANSLVMTPDLVTKVFFPRLTLPLASVLAGLVDLTVALIFLVGVALLYGVGPGVEILLLPALIALAVLAALGIGLWLSSLNVEYRDVRYALPFLVQSLLFLTPIVYPASLVPEPWRTVQGINPMAGVVEGFRWALLGTPFPGTLLLVSSLSALALVVTGLVYFRRVEGQFADVI
jgi:homopolymeric O-antigen transport system permease protein